MAAFVACVGLVLGSSFSVLSGAPGYSVRTSLAVGEFSPGGILVRVRNSLTGEVMQMPSASQFSFQTESGEISDRNCRLVAMRPAAQSVEVKYAHPQFDISVTYEARGDDHFIQKNIRLRHVGDAPFAIKRFSLGQWAAGGQGTLIPFRHGQCVTYFLRQSKGGFFFGVRTPFEEVRPRGTELVDLAYPVNLTFEKGASYNAEAAYWGVYRLRGRYAPKVKPLIDESVMSEIPADIGESEAMLGMVRKLSPPRGGMTLVYNGYQGGLYFGDYGDRGGTEQAERDIELLRTVKEMLGPCIVQPAAPFFGAFKQALRLSPADDRLPEPAGRRVLIDWINANGMKAMNWACLKAVHGWIKPRLGAYCPNHPEWHADEFVSCAANPAYMQWLTRLVLNDLERGFAGFVSDEPGPGLRHQLRCEKPNHGHLPGDVSYAYFVRRREMFREMRKRFGPDFELQGQRPHMDAGIWDMIYLNSVFTLSEDRGRMADTIREWSRMRRHYSFVPSYMDQIMLQPGYEPVDDLMLSALAVSSNYLMIAPSSKEKLKEQEDAILKDNRRIAQGLWEFPEAERVRIRFWLDWAREHREFMDDVIDLPDWPSSGRPDGYLRIRNGAGFAFLFNTGSSEQTIAVPLDAEAKLDSRRTYRLEQLHPDPGPTVIAQSLASWTLPSHSAVLVAIRPVR